MEERSTRNSIGRLPCVVESAGPTLAPLAPPSPCETEHQFQFCRLAKISIRVNANLSRIPSIEDGAQPLDRRVEKKCCEKCDVNELPLVHLNGFSAHDPLTCFPAARSALLYRSLCSIFCVKYIVRMGKYTACGNIRPTCDQTIDIRALEVEVAAET